MHVRAALETNSVSKQVQGSDDRRAPWPRCTVMPHSLHCICVLRSKRTIESKCSNHVCILLFRSTPTVFSMPAAACSHTHACASRHRS